MAEQQSGQLFLVEVDGTPLPGEVAAALVTAVVENDLHRPDSFELTFRDPGRHVLAAARVRIGSAVRLTVQASGSSTPAALLTGEVTALGVEVDATGTHTVVSGYDRSHRLLRGRRCEIYTDVTYADVARTVAQRAGLRAGRIDRTRPVHPRVAQDNTTDWQFLRRLAGEVGFEVSVVGDQLDFRSPVPAAGAPPTGTLTATDPRQLRVGADLLRFTARVSAAEQVAEVEVRGWDPDSKRAVVGVAPAQTTSAENGAMASELAGRFGGHRLVLTQPPYRTQVEVDTAATAAADQVAGACTELSGVARGNAVLRAGTAVSIGLAGEPFDGRYTLSRTQHRYDSDQGYTVSFHASGRQDRSLLALTTGLTDPVGLGGVVPGTVTDVSDPQQEGRVRVNFAWLAETYTSDWLRVVSPGAGPRRGQLVLPEVDDEVLVAFEQGDLRHGYVLGGLYSAVDPPPTGDRLIDATTGQVRRRGFVSRRGHSLVFLDDPAQSGVALLAEDRALRISLNGTRRRIRVRADGLVEILGQQVVVRSSGDATIEATGALHLKGATVKVEASGPVEVAGAVIKLN